MSQPPPNQPSESLDSFIAFDEGFEDGSQEMYHEGYDNQMESKSYTDINPSFEEPAPRNQGRKRASSSSGEKPGKSVRAKTTTTPSPAVGGAAKGRGGRKPGKGKANGGKPGRGKGGKGGEEDGIDDEKREERNLREKERSFKISRQIQMLRDLLNNGGVAVPKGTKSSVLTEAANYIRVLQQHRFNSEVDRQNLVNEIRSMNSGEMGPHVQIAVREAVDTIDETLTTNTTAAHQPQHHLGPGGEVQLTNVAGSVATATMLPPDASLASAHDGQVNMPPAHPHVSEVQPLPPPESRGRLHPDDYSTLFACSAIPMAIATMGGSFIECNKSFEDVSGFPKSILLTMTIFNITSPPALQEAFEAISRMIPRGTVDENGRPNEKTPPPAILSGLLKNGECRLKVFLAKDGAGNTKYFVIQPTPSRVQITQFPTLLENDFVHITG